MLKICCEHPIHKMKRVPIVALFFIFLFGFLLRFTNLNWDSYLAFHPDERNISWAVTRIHFFDQMNPKFFAYGGLPIYTYRALAELVSALTHDTNWIFDWGHIAVIGRYVSATLSSVSILLIYIVARSFFSQAVGLTSAFFLAFSPWAIREAHFATTETSLVFFVLCILWRSLAFLKKPTISGSIILGTLIGLATAAKTTSVLFLLIPFVSALYSMRTLYRQHKTHRQFFFQTVVFVTIFVSALTLTFVLLSPYTILDWQHFTESMSYESGVALGRFPVPYTYQFFNTIPYLYQVKTMLWQAGLVAIGGLIGITVLMIMVVAEFIPRRISKFISRSKQSRTKVRYYVLFLIFPIVYFLWQGSWYTKFARYNIPFLPFLTISASWLMVFLFNKISHKKFYSLICLFVYLIICLFHAWWGFANWTIYTRPQTRVAASQWMFEYIPAQTIIYTEHWNDGLPVYLSGQPAVSYHRELINSFDLDTDQKRKTITKQLEQGDYIIFSTRRIWGTMPKLTDRYPFTSALYRKILNGETDYREIAAFSSYPSLFGITVNDDAAEESLQVFDHPTVRIFKKM